MSHNLINYVDNDRSGVIKKEKNQKGVGVIFLLLLVVVFSICSWFFGFYVQKIVNEYLWNTIGISPSNSENYTPPKENLPLNLN